MSEDISATIRVGVTVILVAALVATVLNLMVISQAILANGQSTLQSGVDRVGLQEFEKYNGKKLSGTEVLAALALYEGRDMAIVVRTNSCINNESGAPWAWNYNSILEDTTKETRPSGDVYKVTTALTQKAGNNFYTKNLKLENGIVVSNGNRRGTEATGDIEFILRTARFRAMLIKDSTDTIVGICFEQLN